MHTYVLIHGAWLGAWCWERVIPLLESAGDRVIAPDLPGHGDDDTPPAAVTAGAYVDAVTSIVVRQEGPVILAGHSMSGMVISQVAERAPEQIQRLVYIAGFLLEDGRSINDTQAQVKGSLVAPRMVIGPDRKTLTFPDETLREAFYADCLEVDFINARQRMKPQPLEPFLAPVHVTADRFGRIPRIYIECLRDRALPVTGQRLMHRRLPCQAVYPLDASHSPFYSRAGELAGILQAVRGHPAAV